MVTYTLTNMCGPSINSVNIAVDSIPHLAVTGIRSFVCIGGINFIQDTLFGSPAGGLWSSQDSGIATVSASGLVLGMQVDSVNMLYRYTNVCGLFEDTFRIAVIPFPTVINIAGPDFLCVGTKITLTDTTGLWANSWSHSGGNVSDSGTRALYITGIVAGMDVITFTATNVCGTSTVEKSITIYPAVVPGPITGASVVCMDSTVVLSDSVSGSWQVSNANASVTDSLIKGISPGSDTIYFTATDACQRTNTVQTVLTVAAPPAPIISRTDNVLSSTGGYNSYQWYYNSSLITGATNDTYIINATDTGLYEESVTSYAGCSGSGFYDFRGLGVSALSAAQPAIKIFPNPGNAEFTVELPDVASETEYQICSFSGVVITSSKAAITGHHFNIRIDDLANGSYMLEVMQSGIIYKQILILLK